MLRTQVPISPEDQGAQSSVEAEKEDQTREVRLKASGEAGSGELRGLPTGKVRVTVGMTHGSISGERVASPESRAFIFFTNPEVSL